MPTPTSPEALTSKTTQDIVTAGKSGSLSQVYADFVNAFLHLDATQRKDLLKAESATLAANGLTNLQIEGLDTQKKEVLLKDTSDGKLYWANSFDKLEAVPANYTQPGFRFADSQMGAPPGTGVWMNVFNYPHSEPEVQTFCASLKRSGVSTLYLETGSKSGDAIAYPDRVDQILDAAHKNGINVVGWLYPTFKDSDVDAAKLAKVADYVSPSGQRFDGVAADLEENLSDKTVSRYSQTLRSKLGWNYPLGAITYSPLNLSPWVGQTPWKTIGNYYDFVAPMDYWHGQRKLGAADYTKKTIEQVHQLTGKPYEDIYAIGDGMRTTNKAFSAFLGASHDCGLTSVSLYPQNHITSAQENALISGRQMFGFPDDFIAPLPPSPLAVSHHRAQSHHRSRVYKLSAGARQ
jgi:hypothetical protein